MSNPAARIRIRNGPLPRPLNEYLPIFAPLDEATCATILVSSEDEYSSMIAPSTPFRDVWALTVPTIDSPIPEAFADDPNAASRIFGSVLVDSTTFLRFRLNTIPNMEAAMSIPINENINLLIRGG